MDFIALWMWYYAITCFFSLSICHFSRSEFMTPIKCWYFITAQYRFVNYGQGNWYRLHCGIYECVFEFVCFCFCFVLVRGSTPFIWFVRWFVIYFITNKSISICHLMEQSHSSHPSLQLNSLIVSVFVCFFFVCTWFMCKCERVEWVFVCMEWFMYKTHKKHSAVIQSDFVPSIMLILLYMRHIILMLQYNHHDKMRRTVDKWPSHSTSMHNLAAYFQHLMHNFATLARLECHYKLYL